MYLEVSQLENRQLSNPSDHTCIVRPEVDKMFSRGVNAKNSAVSKSGNPGPGPVPKTRAQIRILPGDKVTVEMTPYDLTKGRITFRHK